MKYKLLSSLLLMAGLLSASVQAADWSDTSLSWRYGTKFAEPFDSKDISKNIYGLTHVSGYKYGVNFFNVDMLQSDSNDPAAGGASGAQEVYVVYRNTLDIGKISGKSLKFGPVSGAGATLGFDWNTKNDNYSSKKRMLVLGPTLMWDVPGHLNTSLLILKESNSPTGVSRYTYKTHPMFAIDWGIPLGSLPLSFEGFGNFIAPKGKDEFGGDTAAETLVDLALMWDVGATAGMAKNTFRLGAMYEYWKNKFGNNHSGPAGSGAFAKTPMVKAEYHF
ncbi:MAG TPA: outer envelope protein [Burkholderiaceae bacterium]|jgi:nucleoside-specific outer membrane channel protein Tsx